MKRITQGLLHILRVILSGWLAGTERLIMANRTRQTGSNVAPNKPDLTVGILITTFEARQWSCCIPLVESIRKIGCEWPIVVALNGNFDELFSIEDRQNFLKRASKFEDVGFLTFREFTSLSKIWNLGIQVLGTEIVLVLNDDVVLENTQALQDMHDLVLLAQRTGLALANNSFSHFSLSRNLVEEIGWFDERFIGIGEEDGDFAYRYEKRFGRAPVTIYAGGMRNYQHPSGDDLKNGRFSGASKAFARLKFRPHPSGLTGGKYPHPMTQIMEDVNPYPLSTIDRWRGEALRETDTEVLDKTLHEKFGSL